MDALQQPIGNASTILDLNDDCMRSVFEFLLFSELANVADVCTRFRMNAVETARLRSQLLYLDESASKGEYSKMRNFGASIATLCVSGVCNRKSEDEYQKRTIELLSEFCVGEYIELTFLNFEITDEIALLMKPLLGRVGKLSFYDCHLGDALLENLPLWSPKLHELNYYLPCKRLNFEKMAFDFSQLEYIHFCSLKGVKNNEMTKFLMRNPQLKRFKVIHCPDLDDSIFQSIAKYVPTIEEIDFSTQSPTNENNTKHLAQLRKLKSLSITVKAKNAHSYVQAVVHEIASTNIALELLELSNFSLNYGTQCGISRLDKLKSLRLGCVGNLTANRLIDMCKPLKNLSEIKLTGIDLGMTMNDLLNIIGNADKLQQFGYHMSNEAQISIDVDTFQKLVDIIGRRSGSIPLKLELSAPTFTADLPSEVISAASNLIKLIIE